MNIVLPTAAMVPIYIALQMAMLGRHDITFWIS